MGGETLFCVADMSHDVEVTTLACSRQMNAQLTVGNSGAHHHASALMELHLSACTDTGSDLVPLQSCTVTRLEIDSGPGALEATLVTSPSHADVQAPRLAAPMFGALS